MYSGVLIQADNEILAWPESASEDVRDLVESLLKRDPNARLKATELLNHKFLKQAVDKEE